MVFRNREQAARLIAERLARYRGQRPLILAIPRGAVPMGRVIARALDGELDVVLVHKLGAPGQPELAIGAVDEFGSLLLDENARDLGVPDSYLDEEARAQLEMLRRRRRAYSPVRPPVSPAGRVTVVLDDGIATGASLLAALRAVRAQGPARLIAATAVSPPDTLRHIAAAADEVVCLHTPDVFFAVGEFFQDFSQVSDETVMAVLRESAAGSAAEGPTAH